MAGRTEEIIARMVEIGKESISKIKTEFGGKLATTIIVYVAADPGTTAFVFSEDSKGSAIAGLEGAIKVLRPISTDDDDFPPCIGTA